MSTALGGLALGCGDAPTVPSQRDVASLAIVGPTAVLPYHMTDFDAIATYDDGTTKSVRNYAAWDSVGAVFLHPGELDAQQPGPATISVSFGGKLAQLAVTIAYPGLYRLSGVVTDSVNKVPLLQALIQVVSGSGAGQTGNTGTQGRYEVYVAGSVELLVTKNGYAPLDQKVVVSADTTLDLGLTPLAAADVSGQWRMTVTLSPSCQATVPPGAFVRTFDVTITQMSSQLSVVLAAADIVDGPGGHITGTYTTFGVAIGSAVDIELFSGPDLAPALVEQLSPGQWLGVDVTINATLTGDQIASTTAGTAYNWLSPIDDQLTPTSSCHATDNSVVLVRK